MALFRPCAASSRSRKCWAAARATCGSAAATACTERARANDTRPTLFRILAGARQADRADRAVARSEALYTLVPVRVAMRRQAVAVPVVHTVDTGARCDIAVRNSRGAVGIRRTSHAQAAHGIAERRLRR